MAAHIIDGKELAKQVRSEIKTQIEHSSQTPGLVDIIIGGDESTHTYVGIKEKIAQSVGISFTKKVYPANFSPIQIHEYIQEQNANPAAHGIIIQLPLPAHIERIQLLKAVHPYKDVDALHPKNLGSLVEGSPKILSPVVLSVLTAIVSTKVFEETTIQYFNQPFIVPNIIGKTAVCIGNGLLVGRPVAQALSNLGATVTIVTPETPDAAYFTRQADIIVTGTDQANVLEPTDVKDGVIILDVGADVETERFIERDLWISPSIGGIGPMTVAYLMFNTLQTMKYSNPVLQD